MVLGKRRQARKVQAAPGGGLPLSSLTNVAAYADTHWMELFADLGTYSHDSHIFASSHPPMVHRKGWEWTQTIWGLEPLGMLQPEYRAIGVGAGRECVIFWLGDRIAQVVATDLYDNAEWSTVGGREADVGVAENPQAFCPRPIRTEAIEFRTMDGTDLSAYDDGTFDFAWSLSSIEHFGSHERSGDSVREMARVVCSGGVLAVATETSSSPTRPTPISSVTMASAAMCSMRPPTSSSSNRRTGRPPRGVPDRFGGRSRHRRQEPSPCRHQ